MSRVFYAETAFAKSRFPSDKVILRFMIVFCVVAIVLVMISFILAVFEWWIFSLAEVLVVVGVAAALVSAVSVILGTTKNLKQDRRNLLLNKNEGRLFSIDDSRVDILEESLRRDNFMSTPARGWTDLETVDSDYRRASIEQIEAVELVPYVDENHNRFLALRWKLKSGKSFILNVQHVKEMARIPGEFRAYGYPFTSLVSRYP